MKEKTHYMWKKNLIWSALAFGIPFLLCVLVCISEEIYPFGENCILRVDMYHQYYPFFMEFHDKLVEGKSLLYTWNMGLGSDFFAHYAYYLASPLNWLLIFCPKALVIEFMTFTILIKIGLAGMFFFWFLKERFMFGDDKRWYAKEIAIPALVFAIAYAFSGFVAAYYWDIMWMDCVALAPLVVVGLERLVKQNKPVLYYVSLSIAILSNFYMGYILCIFLVLYFLLLFIEQEKEKIRVAIRFAWFSLLAGGTGAILMIPEALVLTNSAAANSDWPKKIEWYFGLQEELSRLCIIATPYLELEHYPNLYCGVFSIFLFGLYVLNRHIKWSQKIPRILIIVFFMVSFVNNYLDCFWHGFRFPNMLPGRQSFLFAFVMLMIGFEVYCKRAGNNIFHMLLITGVCVIGLIFSAKGTSVEVADPIIFWLTGILVVIYGICFVLEHIGTGKLKQLESVILGLMISEIIFCMWVYSFLPSSRTEYLSKYSDYEVLLKLVEEKEKADVSGNTIPFYRVEDIRRETENDSSLYGYSSGSIFSSVFDIDVSDFYERMYMEGGKNYYCYNGATPVISSILSVKYILSDNAGGDNVLREKIASSNDYYIYENKYCLPLGFMMNEEAIENWDMEQDEKISQINDLVYVLGADEPMLIYENVKAEVSKGQTKLVIPEEGFYYGCYDKCDSEELTVTINDGHESYLFKTLHEYLFEFGECKAGDEIKITNSENENVEFSVYKLNLDAVETAYESLSQQTMVTEEFTDTYIKGSVEVSQPGRLILSITDQSGWTLYVDGVETPIRDFKETFISVHLDEGKHMIELRYMSPGVWCGTMITGGCVILFVVTMLIRRRSARLKADSYKVMV